jgi:hypothetical protein
MGQTYQIFDFTYLTRSDGENGRIKEYELYISESTEDWGIPISVGEFENTAAPQTIVFDESVIGRYFRVVALSEVNGNDWASAAEFSLVGCTDLTATHSVMDAYQDLQAFPVPTLGMVNVTIPSGLSFEYSLLSSYGQVLEQGHIQRSTGTFPLNLEPYPSGVYMVQMRNNQGVVYRVKLIKK